MAFPYEQQLVKKNMHLDHPALLSAFSQLHMLPPATRESLIQKMQKSEAQRFFQIPSASSTKKKQRIPFSSVRVNYQLHSRRKANYSFPSNLSCSPENLALGSARS